MSACNDNKSESKVILVSCSGMCVHGQISAGAVHQVLYEKAKGTCDWICPASIQAGIDWQLDRLKNARAIIAVPGCPELCDVKSLRKAGFKPDKIVPAYKVCDFEPWGIELPDIPTAERQDMIDKLSDVIAQEVAKVRNL
ncbi:putative zinc-binding protein [Methanoregula sp.]|uniref:putative zinc-binding protein n=1 Tax=Methanoregula sp. TaxID=2052170 RepID=UPI000CAE427E|nr:putative zinc-binding protein [Methanoregula sp.]PKG31277.1 MAG: hypothetical protein CW742_14245 [Methanoregula sp.]